MYSRLKKFICFYINLAPLINYCFMKHVNILSIIGLMISTTILLSFTVSDKFFIEFENMNPVTSNITAK